MASAMLAAAAAIEISQSAVGGWILSWLQKVGPRAVGATFLGIIELIIVGKLGNLQ